MPITVETIMSFSDEELNRFVDAGKEEQKARAERKKQETIARIKELAGTVGVRVAIGGARGRPVKAKRQPANGNAAPAGRRPA